jgi:polysaccharide biosynthesis protein PslH
MKVLYLAPYLPHPANAGGHLRIHHMLKAIADEHDVAFISPGRPGDAEATWPLAGQFLQPPSIVDLGAAGPEGGAMPPLRAAMPRFAIGAPGSIRAVDRPALWNALTRIGPGNFDIIHIESLALAPFGVAVKRKYPRIKAIINLDNIESAYNWRRLRWASGDLGRFSPRWLSSWRRSQLLNIYRGYRAESSILPHFDVALVCSGPDRERIDARSRPCRVHVVPNGVECASFTGGGGSQADPVLTFIGSMDAEPNQEAVLYFAERVLPLIRRDLPEARFQVVGRDVPEPIRRLESTSPGVEVFDSVPDTKPYLRKSMVSVAPILTGTGTRLKILEAMAAGLPVVSTTIGAEGLGASHGAEILIADDAAGFARSCLSLMADASSRARIGEAGRRFVAARYDWPAIRSQVRDIYDSLAAERGRAS